MTNAATACQTLEAAESVTSSIATEYYKRGVSMLQAADFNAAIECYREALSWGMDTNRLHFSLAMALNGKAKYKCADVNTTVQYLEESIKEFHRAVELCPDDGKAHFHLGALCLQLGDFARGWCHYEWRFGSMLKRPVIADVPIWAGQPLAGTTIVLHAEQGLGDTVQFVRYAPLVKERGGHVVVAAPARLQRLLVGVPGVKRVIGIGESCPEASWQCPLMSLPGIFGTECTTIPNQTPYLHAEPDLIKAWSRRWMGRNLNVGIVWAGCPQNKYDGDRSMTLSLLEPLSRIEGVSLFSLQRGEAAEQLNRLPAGLRAQHLEQSCNDMADTAAAISALDVVVTVDTSVAHVAGALGKSVWIMLPYVPDWRWLLQRSDSPWYPTARLFRQPVPGDWAGVVKAVSNELMLASKLKLSGAKPMDVNRPGKKQGHKLRHSNPIRTVALEV